MQTDSDTARREFLKTSLLTSLIAAGTRGVALANQSGPPIVSRTSVPRYFNYNGPIITPHLLMNPPASAHKFSTESSGHLVYFSSNTNSYLTSADISTTFVVFQLSRTEPKWLEPTAVTPSIAGSTDKPDVLLSVDMMTFHIGEDEQIDQNTKATLRLKVNKDDQSPNSVLDKVFWSMTAALNLWDQSKNSATSPKDLAVPLSSQAFSKRPIEVPGGLGDITFEVVKNKPASWWDEVLQYFTSDSGKQLLSLAGFPAVSASVMGLLDNLLNQFVGDDTEVLFSSNGLPIAFSQYAQNAVTGGYTTAKQGCLNPGYWLLVRGKDYELIRSTPSIFYLEYGMLIPADKNPTDAMKPGYVDPFRNVTYAVMKAGVEETVLAPNFQL